MRGRGPSASSNPTWPPLPDTLHGHLGPDPHASPRSPPNRRSRCDWRPRYPRLLPTLLRPSALRGEPVSKAQRHAPLPLGRDRRVRWYAREHVPKQLPEFFR